MCTLLVELVTSEQHTFCCYAHGDKSKSSRERSCVAVALNLAMLPVAILAHSLMRRSCFAYRLGFAFLGSYVWLGRSSFKEGTANMFRLAALQRRVAQFRSHARHVPN